MGQCGARMYIVEDANETRETLVRQQLPRVKETQRRPIAADTDQDLPIANRMHFNESLDSKHFETHRLLN